MKNYALISVHDKSGLDIICNFFTKKNIGIISTGETAKYIKKIGYNTLLVSELTKFDEILDGRVKTLHPHIYASLLYNKNKKKHIEDFTTIKFPTIGYLIVNLYPFKKSIDKRLSHEKCIEMIDIGGSALLRAASKNYNRVTSICDPQDYSELIKNININNNAVNLKFRKKMAIKSFRTTSEYDKEIFNWMQGNNINASFVINNHKKINLKYGENSHQKAILYKKNSKNFYDSKIHGKELGFNNLKDIDSAFKCVNEFLKPTSVIIKHNSPCGAATADTIYKAFKNSVDSDIVSSFGGVIAVNRTLDKKTALLISKSFYEVILAPKFSNDAITILKRNKNIRLITTSGINKENNIEISSINNGFLIQESNKIIIKENNIKLSSNYKGSKKNIADLIFALKICKYATSNAIVIAKNLKIISIGSGQTSRIASTKIALSKIKSEKNFVAASDAFFPFIDCMQMLIKKKCSAIIQPNGSINDKKIIEFANIKKLPLYFTKYRFFKH